MEVFGRTKDGNGDVTGSHNPNPVLNALTYDVEFFEGEIKECLANAIAKSHVCKQMKMVVTHKSWILLLITERIAIFSIRLTCAFTPRLDSSAFVTQPPVGLS